MWKMFTGFEQTVSQGSSIHFHVRKTLTPPSNDEDDLTIVQNYDTEVSNVGGAMDRMGGTFTAPRSGVYLLIANYFLSGCCPQSNLRLFHNNRVVINGTNASAQEGHLSFSIVLFCRQGDRVYLVARRPGFFEGYLHFIGALLRDE
jgi:C1q domain